MLTRIYFYSNKLTNECDKPIKKIVYNNYVYDVQWDNSNWFRKTSVQHQLNLSVLLETNALWIVTMFSKKQNICDVWCTKQVSNTYMISILLRDTHIVHKLIFECDTMSVHIDDTMCASYYDVFQNLMFPWSRII